MANTTNYDYQLCLEICDKIAYGDNIVNILQSNKKYPTWSTFRRWKIEHNELQTLYVNCQQDKAIALENEIDDYRAMLLSKEIDASTYNVLVQTLKWKMAKFYPKTFGEKLDITSDNKAIKPLEFKIIKKDGD